MDLYEHCTVIKYNQGEVQAVDDVVIADYPLTVILNGQELTTLVCSPGAWPELVAGFLCSAGIISRAEEIIAMNIDHQTGFCHIAVASEVGLAAGESGRRYFEPQEKTKLYFLRDAAQLKPVVSDCCYTVTELLKLSQQLDEQSNTFQITGAAHSVGLGCREQLLYRYEDIGRHNALDKVLGHALLNHIPTGDKCVILSGRVAAEMLLKAAHAGVPLVLSRAAPTALALNIARELGITVVGFARGQRLNIYCNEARVIL